MSGAAILREQNAAIQRRDRPDWWIDTRRVHPERQIRVPMTRGPEAEATARQFFATVSRDPELLTYRAGVLFTWYRQRVVRMRRAQ